MNSLKNPWVGDWQFGRSTTLPAQSRQDHMKAVPKPKSSGTSMEEDSSKKPNVDVVVDKLSGLVLKQQKISEDHRRKLLKATSEGEDRDNGAIDVAGPGHRSSMHFLTEDGCDGAAGEDRRHKIILFKVSQSCHAAG